EFFLAFPQSLFKLFAMLQLLMAQTTGVEAVAPHTDQRHNGYHYCNKRYHEQQRVGGCDSGYRKGFPRTINLCRHTRASSVSSCAGCGRVLTGSSRMIKHRPRKGRALFDSIQRDSFGQFESATDTVAAFSL